MISVRTKITRNNIRSLSRQGRQAAARRNREIAEEVLEEAKKNVHVITGKTRDSGRVEVNGQTGSVAVVFGEGAIYEELGTIYRAPHPFLMPAIETVKKRTRNRRFRMYRG